MSLQTQISFPSHNFDNNIESQITLEVCRKSFEGQNLLLYNLLMSGKKLTFIEAIRDCGISDIRRRSKDLTDVMGVQLSKSFIEGTRNKVWFMSSEQIKFNQEKFK